VSKVPTTESVNNRKSNFAQALFERVSDQKIELRSDEGAIEPLTGNIRPKEQWKAACASHPSFFDVFLHRQPVPDEVANGYDRWEVILTTKSGMVLFRVVDSTNTSLPYIAPSRMSGEAYTADQVELAAFYCAISHILANLALILSPVSVCAPSVYDDSDALFRDFS